MLERLLRVRREVLDAAEASLGTCLRAEADAAALVRRAEDAIRREAAAASDVDAPDAAVEAFARWLPQGQRARDTADAALRDAEVATARARAQVKLARIATETIETLLERERRAERAARDRRTQAELDDIGGRSAAREHPVHDA
ncbi:MAG: flagellar FliJ family protein [Acetobacteraceae bacterium]|nr:flagellar FliJ family protein [Acetobacteraceae bacterium]